MGYERLNLRDHVDKWDAAKVKHLEDGIIAIERALSTGSVLSSGDYDIISNEDYALAICDSEGNIAISLDNNGALHVGHLVGGTSSVSGGGSSGWLAGKRCYVLGDSLSADTNKTGSWHQKFCELTGAFLDANLNRGYFSAGSTATIGTHTDKLPCAHTRAKRLVEHYKEGNPVDVIFIQNVNDINNNRFSAGINSKGADTDLPFFENQVVVYNDAVIEATTASTDVMAYFKEHFSDIIASITPMTGTVVEMLYSSGDAMNAKELTLLTPPTADGNITLTFKHGANYRNEVYSVAVKKGMNIADVIAAIMDWQFSDVGSYDDVEGANGNSVIFSNPYSLVFDGGDTGVTAQVTDTKTINRYPIAFTSLDVADFTNVDSWKYESAVSYWSAQKGMIEYLQKNIPTAKIFYLILPYYKVKYPVTDSAYLRADGSFSMEKWHETNMGSAAAGKLYAEQPLVAKYYGCSVIDVPNNCSINPMNIDSFYPSNDVHPKTAGYNVWGETVARLMAGC